MARMRLALSQRQSGERLASGRQADSAAPRVRAWGNSQVVDALSRPATGDVHAKGVLSAPNAVLHPWLQEELQQALDLLDQEPLAVRVPLPEDHPLLLTWQHWYWSYERPKPTPALRLILIWDNLAGLSGRTTWCAGYCNAASCRSTRRSLARGSTWPSRCNASSCVAPSRASIRKALSKSSTGWSKP